MRRLIKYITPAIILVAFIIWTVLVKTVDVKYIAGIGYLGFYDLNTQVNKSVFEFARTGLFNKVTDVLFYLSFAVALLFVVIGIIQAIKRKSILKADKILYVIATSYVVIVIEYFVFELVKINFSPLSTPDNLKASYPSSHVFIFISIIAIAVVTLFHYFEANKILKVITYISLIALAGVYSAARLFSGEHYLTDIIGADLLAGFIISLFIALKLEFVKPQEEK